MPPALMTERDSASDTSSISSPPQSPQIHNGVADEIKVARPNRPISALGEGVVGGSSPHVTQAHTPSGVLPQPTSAPAKVRKPRKKITPDGQPVPEKKTRKPRETKVKPEGAPAATRKKVAKAEVKAAPAPSSEVTAGPRQSTLIGQFYPPGQPASAPLQPHLQAHPSTLGLSPQPQHSSTSDNMSRSNHTQQQPPSQSSARPYSSGQIYDPIRGSTSDAPPPRPAVVANGVASAQASPLINRASASPSIQSLIDPQQPIKSNAPTIAYAQQTNLQPVPQQTTSFVNHSASPRPNPNGSVVQSLPPSPQPTQTQAQASVAAGMNGAMDIDVVSHEAPKQPALKPQPQSKSSSSAPTPKPSKPVSPPAKPAAKVGTGSGLLSSNNLFGGPSSDADSEPKGLTIDFRIPLNPAGGNQINIAQEIIKKYGGDALDPRAAAHRSRLRAVALAQNKLEANLTDDMSVDLASELDGDSNVEMGGMDDDRSGAGGEPAKKRRKKVEEYDKEDDFIDDRELAWEENAAVAKDGFFVYSGPLVAEGEAAQVESTAPARGRGAGRGRGRGRAGAAAAGAPANATLAARKDPNAPAVPARGRGSRGGRGGAGTTRKKATTKAEKEKLEPEKSKTLQQQHVPPSALVTATASSSALAPGSMPAPVQPQHVLHSNYNGHGQASAADGSIVQA